MGQIDFNVLESASKFFGAYEPWKFALMLICLGITIWLFIFGKVGNPESIKINWSKISDINNQNDESLFPISQYRYLAIWFDESQFKNVGQSRQKLHTLWRGQSEELRENSKKLTISLNVKKPNCNLSALIIRVLDGKISVYNLQNSTGLPANQSAENAQPKLTFELESLKKGERIEILLAVVANDKALYEYIDKQPDSELFTYEVKPS